MPEGICMSGHSNRVGGYSPSSRYVGTVEPLYYGHQGDRNKCPYYRGVRFREVGYIMDFGHSGTK